MELSGATSEAKQANQEVQELVDQVNLKNWLIKKKKIKWINLKLKDHINLRTDSSFQKLTVVSFKSQVVAGTNFFVKVNADDKTHLHLRIFRPLPFQGKYLV